ncbi:MAG: hypothetical protein AB7O97_07090 [Planctomycetota bacterium]
MAVSPAQGTLTLSGHLEERVRALDWDSGKREQLGLPPVAQLVASRTLNPDGIVLTQQELSSLNDLVMQVRGEFSELMREEGASTKRALLQAISRGAVATIDHDMSPLLLDAASMTAYSQRQNEQQRQLMSELTDRLGKPLVDWAYSQMTSTEPDGRPRTSVIWFTKAQEPEVFEVRERIAASRRREHVAVQEFFAGLR